MTASPTVLLIDDSRLNLKLLEAIFSKEGIAVLKAESGEEGRKLAQVHHPDLVLLDIMMPGENGFETCTTLKADPHTADIPIIFVSAVDDDKQRAKGFALGAVDHILKPYERLDIIAKTRQYLHQPSE
jgi:phosphoserine phosphatase RsbU/P